MPAGEAVVRQRVHPRAESSSSSSSSGLYTIWGFRVYGLGVEEKIEATIMGYIRTTRRMNSFIAS